MRCKPESQLADLGVSKKTFAQVDLHVIFLTVCPLLYPVILDVAHVFESVLVDHRCIL